jgi:hypothetical protein
MKTVGTKLTLLALLAAAFLIPAMAWAGSNETAGAPQWNGKNMEAKINAQADDVTQKLGLTPAQRTLFVDMRTAEFNLHKLVHAARKASGQTDAATAAPSADLAAARTAVKSAKEAFLASLNAAQKAQWKELRRQFREKMGQPGEHPQNMTEPPAAQPE